MLRVKFRADVSVYGRLCYVEGMGMFIQVWCVRICCGVVKIEGRVCICAYIPAAERRWMNYL